MLTFRHLPWIILAIATPSIAGAQTPTIEDRAQRRTDALLQQLTHVAEARGITPCQAYERFHTVRPFEGALDPWGRPIEFECRNGVLVVRSAGSDAKIGTRDDVVSGALPGVTDLPTAEASATSPRSAAPCRIPFLPLTLFFVAGIAAWVLVSDLRS
jgi:hypothetical protein